MINRLGRRQVLQGSAATLGALTLPWSSRRADAAGTVQLVSHRYPALEYYAEQVKNADPNVTVNAQLMPFDKAIELMTIALSSGSDSIDLMYVNESTNKVFSKNGWLRPLDDLWEKYSAEFKLDDINKDVLAHFSRDGHIYAIPICVISHLFFYRKDLFEAAGKSVPTTIEQYRQLAAEFNSPQRAGTINCLRSDAALGEAHWYVNAMADGWFDQDWKPVFNNERGVKAISTLKEITQYAQQGFLNAHNDECMIALQQDVATMGVSWTTRAMSMDDPTKSLVVGKMGFAPLPQGHGRLALDGYAISAFSRQDPEMLFRLIAKAASEDSMRGVAALTMVPRTSLLSDPALQEKFRHYPAGLEAIRTAVPFPGIPEWQAVSELIRRRILQAVTGEMQVAEALDVAAEETRQNLAKAGYYN